MSILSADDDFEWHMARVEQEEREMEIERQRREEIASQFWWEDWHE